MVFDFSGIIWVLLLILTLWPLLKQRNVYGSRLRKIREIELKRNTRVIALIHRQEMLSILGLPITRHINIEDSEQVLRAIRLTPDDMPIDIILHTPGGLVLAADQIAHAIKNHPAKVTVFVPHYAMSGGTFIAAAADEIVMEENAVLGPVDPQVGGYPAASIISVLRNKPHEKVDDQTMMLADIAGKAINQVRRSLFSLLKDKFEKEDEAARISRILTEGRWTHDFPITYELLREMGFPVSLGLLREMYELMELYPQPAQRRPSVQYIPVPYRRAARRENENE